jgi:hypothetical protein
MAEGGKGGSGTLINEESKRLHSLGIEKTKLLNTERRGKTYEEIYGERAEEEKNKRRLAGLGKKYDEERIKKVSESLRGRSTWNKGLTNAQVAWNKGLTNVQVAWNKGLTDKISFKIYHLITKNEKLEFDGKKELEKYIKSINVDRKKNNKINVDRLVSEKVEREFSLEIFSKLKIKS